MSLPFILDVALGLIFVYLILSLLASEIQELIATLLQWRAKHLRESVTNLLSGEGQLPGHEQERVKELVNKVYSDPLIRNINQASIRGIKHLFRRITWIFGDLLNRLFQVFSHRRERERTFGKNQRSAPSYIPAETFATTLIESIGISNLSRLLVQKRLEDFQERLVEVIQETLIDVTSIEGRINKFNSELRQVVKSYEGYEASLEICILRTIESLDRLSAFCNVYPGCSDEVRNELRAIKANYFGERGERAYLLGLQTSASELIELVDKGSRVYREIKPLLQKVLSSNSEGARLAKIVDEEIAKLANKPIASLTEEDHRKSIDNAIESLRLTDEEIGTLEVYKRYQQIDQAIDSLPRFVKESLRVLARRTESRVRQIESQVQEVSHEIDHLRQEIEAWFDRSMDRASGVYKRNAKGFALILGFVLAVATNSDTFHIFSRFSNDEKLRQIVVQNASAISQKNNSSDPNYLSAVKSDADKALKEISLPIGWNPAIVKEQLCSETGNSDWSSAYKCRSERNLFWTVGSAVTMLIGWLVSGIAIAMGAPFWFDILSKVVNVRNTGKPPESSTTGQTTSSSDPTAPGS